MTQHILTLSNYLTNPIIEIGSLIKSGLKSFFKAVQKAQQEKANRMIAEMLHNSEYSNESFDYVLEMVRKGQIDAINSK